MGKSLLADADPAEVDTVGRGYRRVGVEAVGAIGNRGGHAIWLGGYGFSVVRYSTKSTNSCRDIPCCRPDGIIESFCFSRLRISDFL